MSLTILPMIRTSVATEAPIPQTYWARKLANAYDRIPDPEANTSTVTDSRKLMDLNPSAALRLEEGMEHLNGSRSRPVALRRVRPTTNPMESAFRAFASDAKT
jgi:hypothetical protein